MAVTDGISIPDPKPAPAPPRPIGARAFDAAMAALGPFENHPRLAVAVSGGADSMALACLAADWAARHGGSVTALSVDHGLRAGSADEARQVGRWLRARGIPHRVLVWRAGAGAPRRALQARARAARYELLEGWCARNGVVHLLSAHHRDDQAETFLLRLAAQSGPRGLAAMAAVRELAHVRLLRPLLAFSRAETEATLATRGQDWITDPSNADPAFARARLRALAPALEAAGLGAAQRAALAARFAGVRRALDARVAARLARACAPHPAGFIRVETAALADGPDAEGAHALARILGAVSGAAYAPRGARLARLYDAIRAERFTGATLGGCRVLPVSAGHLLVCREPAALAAPIAVTGPETLHWDGRFVLRLTGRGRGCRVGALGADGWRSVMRRAPEIAQAPAVAAIPAPVRATLPALFGRSGPRCVPHIGYGPAAAGPATLRLAEIRPLVAEPLAGPRFSASLSACYGTLSTLSM